MHEPTPIHAQQVYYALVEDTVKLEYQLGAGATMAMGCPVVAAPPCDLHWDNQKEVEGQKLQETISHLNRTLNDMCEKNSNLQMNSNVIKKPLIH